MEELQWPAIELKNEYDFAVDHSLIKHILILLTIWRAAIPAAAFL